MCVSVYLGLLFGLNALGRLDNVPGVLRGREAFCSFIAGEKDQTT